MNYQKYIPLIARVFLVLIFFRSGLNKILDFSGTQETIASKGLPLPALLAIGAIVFELVGATLITLGYRARLGAILLLLFLIPTTLVFHGNFSDGMQLSQFFKNLALIGGLLLVFSLGSGPLSLDERNP